MPRSGANRGMGKIPASCKLSRQAHPTSSGLGATFCVSQGRYRHRFTSLLCSTWSINHSVRAAAMTNRKVLAPTMRCRLRHWSCPRPSKALVSRMSISTAQRSPYSLPMSSTLKDRSVVQKASMAGRGFRWPGLFVMPLPSRLSTTTRIRRPGNPACHLPHQACILVPAALG